MPPELPPTETFTKNVTGEDVKEKEAVEKKAESASLANRIFSRTTDLIAIAIVVIAAMTVGRQMVIWWSVDDSQNVVSPVQGTAADASLKWGEGESTVAIQFGHSRQTLRRTDLRASGEQLQQKLVLLTQQMIESSQFPLKKIADQTNASVPNASVPNSSVPNSSVKVDRQSEAKILKYLLKQKPVFQDGSSEVYFTGGPTAMMWGVRVFTNSDLSGLQPHEQKASMQKTSLSSTRRIVCWGTCLPKGEDTWSVYLSPFGDIKAAVKQPEVLFELPESCAVILSLRNADSSSVIHFQSSGTVEETQKTFQHLPKNSLSKTSHWKPVQEWLANKNGSYTRSYLLETSHPLTAADATGQDVSVHRLYRANVQLREDSAGRTRGIIVVSTTMSAAVQSP